MGISYSSARNTGLLVLLALILLEGAGAWFILSRHAVFLEEIIGRDERALHRWHDIGAIIAEAKDRMYDFSLGTQRTLAAVDLLVTRALAEVETLPVTGLGRRELDDINELVVRGNEFRGLLRQYGQQLHGGTDADQAALGRCLAAAQRMAMLGRSAVTHVSDGIQRKHQQILRETAVSKRVLAGGLLLATAVTMLVAALLARSLAKPVQEMVAATKRLAAGELEHQVQVHSRDAIGDLAAAFNRMAGDLRRSRDQLVAAKKYTDNILRSMINSLVVVDSGGNIETVNEATCQMLGYGRDELLGRPMAVLFAAGYFEQLNPFELLRTHGSGQVESAYQTKQQQMIPVLLSGSGVRDEENRLVGMVFVAQDRTVQAEAMRAGHLASLGELAAGVAHEINNPLNSIINFAQLLWDEWEEDGTVSRENIQRIIAEGDRVSAIVRSLLSFARAEEKEGEPLSVAAVLAETLALTGSQLRKEGIVLEQNIEPNLPQVCGHFQRLQQVFLNLINNGRYAINQKFAHRRHGKKMVISLGQQEDPAMVVVVFEDNGVGIPAALLDKIKNPFFSTKPTGKGTGLGLTISHGIVADHGGRLLIDSREGEYTRAEVQLPIYSSAPT